MNVRRQPDPRSDRSAKGGRSLPVHPAERLSNGARRALVLVSVVAGAEMLMAFRALQHDAAGRTLPMLESMARGGGWWAMFGRAGAWLLTFAFFFDHGENLFLWREIGGRVGAWEPPIAWTLHAMKWMTGFLGGLSVLVSSVAFVGARRQRHVSD